MNRRYSCTVVPSGTVLLSDLGDTAVPGTANFGASIQLYRSCRPARWLTPSEVCQLDLAANNGVKALAPRGGSTTVLLLLQL